jgi:hypothetical protein
MNPLTMRQFCERIYCAYLAAADLVVDDQRTLAFAAVVTERNERTEYQVEFLGVTDFTNGAPAACDTRDVIELSSVEVERMPSGWSVTFAPFAAYDIHLTCVEIRLNGMRVAGAGKWRQDSLPNGTADVSREPPPNDCCC